MGSKNKSTDSENPSVSYGADTSGFPIERLPELVRKRAYELLEARSREPGREWDDWLQAENEIKRRCNL
jgi:hypothetical protein